MTVFAFVFGSVMLGYLCSLIRQKIEEEDEQ